MADSLEGRVDIVPELGRYNDIVALIFKSFCDDLFAVSVAVSVSSVDEINPQVVSADQQVNALLLSDLAPPVGADSPRSETDFGDVQICLP